MFSALRKVVTLVTLVTTLVVAVRELKLAIDAFRSYTRRKDHKTA